MLALVAALLLVVAFRAPILRALASVALGIATGDRVSIGGLDVSSSRLVVRDLRVSRGSDPLLDAERVDARYDLHDLIFGGSRRYGLSRIELDRPHASIVRHADGSFNLASGTGVPSSPAGATTTRATRLAFALVVRDGRVTLHDPFRKLAIARDLAVDDVDVDANVDSATRTTYRGTAHIAGVVGSPAGSAVAFRGRVDADGFAVHRVRSARIALPAIVDYFVNAPSAAVLRGSARDLDVGLYAFPHGAYHLTGGTTIEGGAMHVPGLVVDATDMNGRIDVYDGGLATPDLVAKLGGLDVRLAGGLYDFHAPTLRLGIVSETDLASARGLFRFSRRLALGGRARIGTLLEGPVGTPLVATRVVAPAVSYGRFPVTAVAGRAIYYASHVDVVDARGTYGGIAVATNGTIALGTTAVRTDLAVAAESRAATIPYLAQAAPAATVRAEGVLAGVGVRFDACGFASGSGGGVTLAAPFHVDPLGDGAFGPIVAERDDGARLGGTFYLDRSHGRSAFWLDARDFPVSDLGGFRPHLPGLALAAPVFAGRIDGELAGIGSPSAFRLAGTIHGRGLRVGAVAIDDVSGDAAGALGNLRLGAVVAAGPWGGFRGAGSFAGGRLSLAGSYAGSFERLRAFTGDVGGTGAIAGPVALLIDPQRTIVQARGESSPGSAVRGVPVDGIAGTLAVAGKRLRVFVASAVVAGGDLVAAGDPTGPDGVGVSLADAAVTRVAWLSQARAGRAYAIGRVHGERGSARFDGGLAVVGAAPSGGPVSLDATGGPVSLDATGGPVSFDGDAAISTGSVAFDRTDVLAYGAYGVADGSVLGAGSPEPTYDVAIRLPSVSIAPLARLVAPGGADVAGTLAGDVRVRGRYGALAVDARVAVPEGSYGGLRFSDASTRLTLDASGARARDGNVRIGSTDLRFAASLRGPDASIAVNAPRADLSDFNDLFDAGDTLGGRGRVAFRYVARGRETRANADIAIAGLRYRRFDLGDARAVWNSTGRSVRGSVAFGGESGRLGASGTLVLPSDAARGDALLRSRFDGRASLAGLDLGVWLPALGYQVPIAGRVDANATIAGLLRNPAISTTATLRSGSIGKFPVDRLTITASSTLDRTTIRKLEIELPSISIVGTGEFGLADRSPLALSLRATSPDLGILSSRIFGTSYAVAGAADLDVAVDGTRNVPRVVGKLDVRSASLHGVLIPRAVATFSLRGRDVVLSDASVDFATGSLALDGSVPFEIEPFALGPAGARVALSLAAKDVELADFAPLLPAGSLVRGRIDGTVAIGGTAGSPHLAGRLALTAGSFESPLERVPLDAASATLGFDGNSARLDSFHASAGGGAVDASGSVRFADLVHPGADAAFDFVARADKLRLDLPAYGTGTIDGTLGLARIAGGLPTIEGDLRLSDGTIPFSAFLFASNTSGDFDASAVAPGATPIRIQNDVAFNLDVAADRNVRVRSANVDIGSRGGLHVGGTRSAPSLTGGFTSTGGTISYFNTVFRLIDGTVTFLPELGVIPTLDAHAVTHAINPDPNTLRNLAGTADITLSLVGPVTNLSIGLSSEPAYDRQQILGLLLNAPALGASNLFGENRDQATLYGSNSTATLPSGVTAFRTSTGELSVAQEAFGVANAQFTRTLLAPIETSFAQAVGLSNFNVNVDYTGNVGVTARKVLGKKLNAIYGSTFGYPYRQTFGFEFRPNVVTAAQVTVFEAVGANGLNSLTPVTSITSTSNARINATQPSAGTAGFSLSLQRLF
jgi:hypothetical protein